MKRHSVWSGIQLGLCLAALLAARISCGAEAPATAKNLARNPSFELDVNKDGSPDAWDPFELCTPHHTTQCSRDAQVAREGKHSAMIAQGSLYCTITGTKGWLQHGIVEKGGGKTYRVSVYVRAGKPEKVSGYIKTIFPTRVRLYLFV